MALTAATVRKFKSSGLIHKIGVTAVTQIWEGGAVSAPATGYARPGAAAAGESFLGFADEDALGGSANGDVRVALRVEGLVRLSVANVTTVASRGVNVYATDDDTFTDAAGVNNLLVGKVLDVDDAGLALVHFQATPLRSL